MRACVAHERTSGSSLRFHRHKLPVPSADANRAGWMGDLLPSACRCEKPGYVANDRPGDGETSVPGHVVDILTHVLERMKRESVLFLTTIISQWVIVIYE